MDKLSQIPFARVCHWGPLLALGIVKSVTLTTMHLTSMWLPPFESLAGFINYALFLFFVGSTLYHFFCAMFIGPGYVPPKWHPDNPDDVQYLQFCNVCQGYKSPRAHHCRKCQRCVMKMDHHCPWINHCCGHFNHANFTLFLLSAVCGCIQATVLMCIALYRAFHVTWYMFYGDRNHVVYLSMYSFIFAIFSLGLAIGVVIAVGGLFIVQMKSIIKNETSIESWIVSKAQYRTRSDVFVYPYNLGWWKNVKQVFWDPPCDGFTWPVVDGCNQYTLTVEQLQQKECKRARSRQYTVIEPYNGSWFPISKGLRICCSCPCNEEPRIPLQVGQNVNVTRWKRHWLYGEIAEEEIPPTDGGDESKSKDKVKGWFPRRCVVEFTSADCEISKATKKYL